MKIYLNEQKFNTLEKAVGFENLFNHVGQDTIVIMGDYTYCIHEYNPCRNQTNIFITDITNAGKFGTTCPQVKLEFDITSEFVNVLMNTDFDDLFFHLVTDDKIDGVIMKYFIKIDAKKVYNPLTLKNVYKPLKEEPKKWTLRHVIKALVNNQFIDLRCDGVYTDDYAYDNAVDFQKGALKVKEFVKKLINNGSYGWRTYSYENRIHVNCHHFEYNSFKFVLNGV